MDACALFCGHGRNRFKDVRKRGRGSSPSCLFFPTRKALLTSEVFQIPPECPLPAEVDRLPARVLTVCLPAREVHSRRSASSLSLPVLVVCGTGTLSSRAIGGNLPLPLAAVWSPDPYVSPVMSLVTASSGLLVSCGSSSVLPARAVVGDSRLLATYV
ncbi:hypothetical protein ACOMHN_036782 [Nucella lapillus]